MTKNEMKELRYAIYELSNALPDIEDDDEYDRQAEKINNMICEYHNERFNYMLRRGEVENREEYNEKYGVFK